MPAQNEVTGPIGGVDFLRLREFRRIYVDKTDAIYRLIYGAQGKTEYVLAPSGFGKTLLLSTLEAYFAGSSHLFTGLKIEALESWREHHSWLPRHSFTLDYTQFEFTQPGDYDAFVLAQINQYERQYDLDVSTQYHPQRIIEILDAMHEVTGNRPVILVDHFDRPVAQTLAAGNRELLRHFGLKQKELYGTLHSYERHFHFAVYASECAKPQPLPARDQQGGPIPPCQTPLFGFTADEVRECYAEPIAQIAARRGLEAAQVFAELEQYAGPYVGDQGGPMVLSPRLVGEYVGTQLQA